MRTVHRILLATALLAAPAPVLAQTPAPQGARAEQQDGRAAGFLLRHRAELGLSDEQVARMNAIAARLQEQNRPLVDRLRAAGLPVRPQQRTHLREMTPEQRRELRAKFEEHRPTLQQLRANTRAAVEEARAVLTPQQQERARTLMRERKGEHRGKGRPGDRGRRPGS
jgi:Spy/CpxP family protein refolding chaperone